MISKEVIDQLEKIPCTLKDGGFFQYLSEDKKGNIKLKCPKCAKKGLSNIIKVQVTPKKEGKNGNQNNWTNTSRILYSREF